MAERSSHTPHSSSPYGQLEGLITRALRRYGDMAASTADGEFRLLMLDFANLIIEDIRLHPYWDGGELDYYQSLTEFRPIPDEIIVAGIAFYYGDQQGSDRVQSLARNYYMGMNRILYQRRFGNPKIEMSYKDGPKSVPSDTE